MKWVSCSNADMRDIEDVVEYGHPEEPVRGAEGLDEVEGASFRSASMSRLDGASAPYAEVEMDGERERRPGPAPPRNGEGEYLDEEATGRAWDEDAAALLEA